MGEIRPLHPVFVGEVSGVDLTRPLNADEVAGLEAGMDRYAVLVYRGQAITDEQQIAFSQNFGKLELPDNKSNITKAKDRRLRAELADVSNLNKENKPYGRDDRQRMFNLGNQLWHSDSSFRAIPAKYSLLSGRRIPPEGGNTEFADMRAAYDALDAKTKELLAVAISVAVRCDPCITYHVEGARKHGATREEIAETMGLAVYMGAGPSAMYAAQALEAYDQYADKAAG